MNRFNVNDTVIVRSSGIARTIVEVIDTDTYVTASGDHKRTMKAANLCTREEYTTIYNARRAKLNKKFGRR